VLARALGRMVLNTPAATEAAIPISQVCILFAVAAVAATAAGHLNVCTRGQRVEDCGAQSSCCAASAIFLSCLFVKPIISGGGTRKLSLKESRWKIFPVCKERRREPVGRRRAQSCGKLKELRPLKDIRCVVGEKKSD
jgi:hypothetical protein